MNNLMYKVGAAVGSMIRGFRSVSTSTLKNKEVVSNNTSITNSLNTTERSHDIPAVEVPIKNPQRQGGRMKDRAESIVINSSQSAAEAFWKFLNEEHEIEQEQEQLWVIGLSAGNQVKFAQCVFSGTLDSVMTHPREVFRMAIHQGAIAIVVAHNHPNGDPTPSQLDIETTRKLREASRVVEIPILDHIVMGNKTGKFRSLAKYCDWKGEDSPKKGEGECLVETA